MLPVEVKLWLTVFWLYTREDRRCAGHDLQALRLDLEKYCSSAQGIKRVLLLVHLLALSFYINV